MSLVTDYYSGRSMFVLCANKVVVSLSLLKKYPGKEQEHLTFLRLVEMCLKNVELSYLGKFSNSSVVPLF
jgi:hypothetical protein